MPVARWSIRRLYIPCCPHTAARSTNGCCTQPTLRHKPLHALPARSPPARLGLRADPDVQGDVREFAFFSGPRVYMTGVALDTHGERSLQTSWILKDTCLMLSVSPQHATKNCGSSRRRTPTWAASRVAC